MIFSTIDAINKLVDYIAEGLQVIGVFLDLYKAFDSIHHAFWLAAGA